MAARIRQRIFSSKQTLSDRQKAVTLLFAIGPELSAAILEELSEAEIEMLVAEIAHAEKLSQGVTDSVLKEFHDLYEAQGLITKGGLNSATDMLERSLGKTKGREIIEKLTASLKVAPFHFLHNTDPGKISSFLEGEHPQTIALVLAHLRPEQASVIIDSLESNLRAEVIRRIVLMDRIAPDIVAEVETILESKATVPPRENESTVCGVETAVRILDRVDKGTEHEILEMLAAEDPELADAIRRELFKFEDIVDLEDHSIQRLVEEISYKKFALALKAANEDLKEKILANMPQEAGEILEEHMEFLGPVRLRDVEQAQREIIDMVHFYRRHSRG